MTVIFNLYLSRSDLKAEDGRVYHVEWNAAHPPEPEVLQRWEREYGRLIYSGQHSQKQIDAARHALVPVLNGIEEGERYSDKTLVHLVKTAVSGK